LTRCRCAAPVGPPEVSKLTGRFSLKNPVFHIKSPPFLELWTTRCWRSRCVSAAARAAPPAGSAATRCRSLQGWSSLWPRRPAGRSPTRLCAARRRRESCTKQIMLDMRRLHLHCNLAPSRWPRRPRWSQPQPMERSQAAAHALRMHAMSMGRMPRPHNGSACLRTCLREAEAGRRAQLRQSPESNHAKTARRSGIGGDLEFAPSGPATRRALATIGRPAAALVGKDT